MWLFTKYGFYSVVCARKGQKIDYSRLQIRARVRGHLEALRTRFADLKGLRIIETKNADYRYRMIVPRRWWEPVHISLLRELDYDNFKDAASKTKGSDHESLRFKAALHRVWASMRELQYPKEILLRGGRSGPSLPSLTGFVPDGVYSSRHPGPGYDG